MAIQYLTYAEIDLKKWDDCILRANNGLIYAYSFYLNQMAPNWDALVMDDYDAVMPLTWNKKYGIHYLYQPAFTASLGVFGKDIDASKLNAFLNAIPDKFKYWDICLNHQNCFPVADFTLYERVNYVLPLQQPYEILFSQFRESTQRNIKKSKDLNCVIKKNIAAEDIISLSQTQALKFDAVTNEDFKHIGNLYSLLLQQEQACNYAVYSNSELVAAALFFFSNKRAYYILVGNHPNSKVLGASHALINAFIKDHAEQDLSLDFEGSDISSLAFFYGSFGAVIEKYAALRLNRLPVWAKWMKRS